MTYRLLTNDELMEMSHDHQRQSGQCELDHLPGAFVTIPPRIVTMTIRGVKRQTVMPEVAIHITSSFVRVNELAYRTPNGYALPLVNSYPAGFLNLENTFLPDQLDASQVLDPLDRVVELNRHSKGMQRLGLELDDVYYQALTTYCAPFGITIPRTGWGEEDTIWWLGAELYERVGEKEAIRLMVPLFNHLIPQYTRQDIIPFL